MKQPERKSIPDAEYGERVERLQRRMHEQRLDAVLLGTGMNLQYLSGLPSPQRSVVRPFFLLIDSNGAPILSHIAFADELVASQRSPTYGPTKSCPGRRSPC